MAQAGMTQEAPVSQQGGVKLPKLTVFQLFSLAVGIIGIQFVWSMQVAFSSRVLEPLGANPFLFGLIWCAGPITGILVQPLVGAWSDKTWTRFGRRKPFIIVGTLLSAASMVLFPISVSLLMATILLWIIDASTNTVQGPYRALVPDCAPPEQHVVANSYINFAFGAGSIIAMGVAPLLLLFHVELSLFQQYLMTSIVFIIAIGYSSLMIKEYPRPEDAEKKKEKVSFAVILKKFTKYDREIHKLCAIQFVTWVGMMSMFIYLTPYVVHNIYGLPDMSTKEFKQVRMLHEDYTKNPEAVVLSEAQQKDVEDYAALHEIEKKATNTSQLAFVAFNTVALILAIPLGYLCTRFGKKRIYQITLGALATAFLFAPFIHTPNAIIIMMTFAGVAQATVLSIPFAFLCDYTPPGEEGTLMGVFNMFVAGPQLISTVVVGWLISQFPVATKYGMSHNWTIAFMIASGCVFVAVIGLQFLNEKRNVPANAQ